MSKSYVSLSMVFKDKRTKVDILLKCGKCVYKETHILENLFLRIFRQRATTMILLHLQGMQRSVHSENI